MGSRHPADGIPSGSAPPGAVPPASPVEGREAADVGGRPLARLKTRAEFLRVAGARRKWATPGLVLQAAPRRRNAPPVEAATRPEAGATAATEGASDAVAPPSRVGFTTSRKVGKAVVRNRARRRLRAVADAILPREALPGHDYVLIGRAETPDRPYALLLGDLRAALRRLGLRR